MVKKLNFVFHNYYETLVDEIWLGGIYIWDCLLLSLTLFTIKIDVTIIIKIIIRSPTVIPLSFKFIVLNKLHQL